MLLYWYKDFTVSFKDLDLNLVSDSNCLFVNNWLILFFYIDDIIAVYNAAKYQKQIDEFEAKLFQYYEIRILEDTEYFLSIRII